MCNGNCNCNRVTESDLQAKFKAETGLDPLKESNEETYNRWTRERLLRIENENIERDEFIENANADFKQASEDEINKIIDNEL